LDWNAQSQRWEVSLRIYAGDLELALAMQSKTAVDLENKSAIEAIQRYLSSRFFLTARSNIDNDSESKVKEYSPANSSQPLQEVLATQQFAAQQLEAFPALTPSHGSQSDLLRLQRSSTDAEVFGKQRVYQSNLEWVGHEMEGSWVWLYFELVPDIRKEEIAEGDAECQVLVSQLLTEVNDDQLNIVTVRTGNRRSASQTSRTQPWMALPKP
jgi:hypothetical protein